MTVPPAGGHGAGVELTHAVARAHANRDARDQRPIRIAPPFAGNEFSRADRLLVRVALFGDSADATVASRLVGRQGRDLVDAPDRAARQAAPGSYQIDLPLQSVAPGDYVIAIEATKGTERAETFVAIRVAG